VNAELAAEESLPARQLEPLHNYAADVTRTAEPPDTGNHERDGVSLYKE